MGAWKEVSGGVEGSKLGVEGSKLGVEGRKEGVVSVWGIITK